MHVLIAVASLLRLRGIRKRSGKWFTRWTGASTRIFRSSSFETTITHYRYTGPGCTFSLHLRRHWAGASEFALANEEDATRVLPDERNPDRSTTHTVESDEERRCSRPREVLNYAGPAAVSPSCLLWRHSAPELRQCINL